MNDAGHPGHAGKPLNLLTEMRGSSPLLPRMDAGQLTLCAPHSIQPYQGVARMPRMPRMSKVERVVCSRCSLASSFDLVTPLAYTRLPH